MNLNESLRISADCLSRAADFVKRQTSCVQYPVSNIQYPISALLSSRSRLTLDFGHRTPDIF